MNQQHNLGCAPDDPIGAMPGSKMIASLLKRALRRTYSMGPSETERIPNGKKHAMLSGLWVESLAMEFRRQFNSAEGYRVFSKKFCGNKPDFPIQEYLYDITVVRTKKIKSAVKDICLECPYEILWHIESEFQSSNSRSSILDFGKLLMSGAQERLMVLPSGGSIQRWASGQFRDLRNDTPGKMWLAFVPHPREWRSDSPPTAEVKQIW